MGSNFWFCFSSEKPSLGATTVDSTPGNLEAISRHIPKGIDSEKVDTLTVALGWVRNNRMVDKCAGGPKFGGKSAIHHPGYE